MGQSSRAVVGPLEPSVGRPVDEARTPMGRVAPTAALAWTATRCSAPRSATAWTTGAKLAGACATSGTQAYLVAASAARRNASAAATSSAVMSVAGPSNRWMRRSPISGL